MPTPSRRLRFALAAVAVAGVAAALVFAFPPAASSHPATPGSLGVAKGSDVLEAVVDTPGPVTVETVVAADWVGPRSGLLDLDDPAAKAAGLKDGDEPIQIYFHALRHPSRGLFVVDTGVEAAQRDAPDRALLRGLVARAMRVDALRVVHDLGGWLAAQTAPPAGVFLTHLHLDHISGMRDVPAEVPVYTGPGETKAGSVLHLASRSIVDEALGGKGPLREWPFAREEGGAFEAVLDVFGDESVWALHVPGHTPGSTAYLARTPGGPVLLVGDASHTVWGWEHGVAPGGFSLDRRRSTESLRRLKAFVARHPRIDVRLGHQRLTDAAPAPAPPPAP